MILNHFSRPRFNATTDGDASGTPSPAPAPAPTPAPVDPDLKAKLAEFEETKKQLDAMNKKLAEYTKKEQEEAEKQKTVEQKLAEKEAELAKAKRESLVVKLAASKGLDTDLIDRVRGEDEAAITADIDLLLAKFSAKETPGDGARGGRTPAGKAQTPEEPDTPTGKFQQSVQDFHAWRQESLKK